MEDALVHAVLEIVKNVFSCLNPCFNGRCTRTNVVPVLFSKKLRLNPCFNGRCTRTT